jgi:hypothetical protein
MPLDLPRTDDLASPTASPLEVTDHLEIDRYETRLASFENEKKLDF